MCNNLMQKMAKNNNPPKLDFGKYYHIFNSGVNNANLFFCEDNYAYFMRLYDKYINPISDTLAWCLMPNHFHFFVRIYEENELNAKEFEYSTVEKPKCIDPSKQFSHLFNAYTQAINKQRQTRGSLFKRTFVRKQVDDKTYFRHLIYYIHNNPVFHGFCETMFDYKWSSFQTMVSLKPTKTKRDFVIDCFRGRGNFVDFHTNQQKIDVISQILIE